MYAVRHKITNPLIPQQAGVIPMPTGGHDQGLVLDDIERAASAANPCIHNIRIENITGSVGMGSKLNNGWAGYTDKQ